MTNRACTTCFVQHFQPIAHHRKKYMSQNCYERKTAGTNTCKKVAHTTQHCSKCLLPTCERSHKPKGRSRCDLLLNSLITTTTLLKNHNHHRGRNKQLLSTVPTQPAATSPPERKTAHHHIVVFTRLPYKQ